MVNFNSLIGSIEFTDERRLHILKTHPELKPHMNKISKVLAMPDEIRISRIDNTALLFYKYFANIKGGKYITVTVKTERIRNFILTAYITDRIRIGEIYEIEKQTS